MSKNNRILVVDDDERNIRILFEILEDDFELYSAPDGESALEKVERVMPDIILLDIMMPGIDGYEVCKVIKKSDKYRNIKIILVSGKALAEERIKGYEVGADDFVAKPFDVDEIYAKVKVFAKLKSLEEVNKLKTDFLNLINHETGTPLNHIIGTSDLLLMDDKIDSAIADSIKDINLAAHSLNDKISNILFLSKLKQRTLSDVQDVDIKSAILESAGRVGAGFDKLNIQHDLKESREIKGDLILLDKLFSYLFRNAVNVSTSAVTCRIKGDAINEGVPGILVEIEDSGPTITDSERLNFFDPFYVDNLMLHGEGLNTIMAICFEITTLHRGTINIRRNNESGSCLSVWLPNEQVA